MALNFNAIDRSASFNPIQAFPLDKRSYFESYDAALAAAQIAEEAGSSNVVYYYGQTVSVYTAPVVADPENNIEAQDGYATLYIIQPDQTLKEVGSVPLGDNVSVEISEDGEIELKGFGKEYYRYNTISKESAIADGAAAHPLRWYKEEVEGSAPTFYQSKEVDGAYAWVAITAPTSDYLKVEGFIAGLEPKVVSEDGALALAWFEPNPTTVEGLASQITSLSATVQDVQTASGNNTQAINKINGADAGKSMREVAHEEANLVATAAMEFKGAIYELPTGLGKAETGHFYKVAKDIYVTSTAHIDNINKHFNFDTPEGTEEYEIDLSRYQVPEKGQIILEDIVDDPAYASYAPSFKVKIKYQFNYAYGDQEDDWSEIYETEYYSEDNQGRFNYDIGNASGYYYHIVSLVIQANSNVSFDWTGTTLQAVWVAEIDPIDTTVIEQGASIVWDGGKWYVIPSGDAVEDTWRKITKTYINEEGEKVTETVSNRATLDIKPGFADFVLTDTKATLDLTPFEVRTVKADESTGNVVTEVTLNDKGEIIVSKGNIEVPTIPDIVITPADGDVDTEDLVSVITKATATGHTITPEFVNVPTQAYVEKLIDGIVIPTIPDITVNEKAAEEVTGIAVVTKVETNEDDGHKLDVTFSDIPRATATALGLVKSSEEQKKDKVKVENDGTMTVVDLNVNKLYQTAGEFMYINGGNAAANGASNA